MSDLNEPQPLLAVALYAEQPPALDLERLRTPLAKRFGSVELVATEEDVAVFALHDLPAVDIEGERAPCTLSFLSVHEPDRETLEASLSQTWDWSEAREVAASAVGSHIVMPMMSWAELDYKTRLDLVHRGVSGLLDQTDPVALHWPQCQRVVAPHGYRHARADGANRLYPQANVRIFRVEEGQPGELFMDTLGLFSLGLPDLQIRFTGVEPDQIAAQLFSIALYVYEHGDVIKDGDTVQGVPASASWVCNHASSSIAPDRPMLELKPV
jgi:hypothetical protein